MRNLILKLLISGSLSFVAFASWAQPCIQNWKYRQPIFIDNTSGPSLQAFQVKLVLNSQDLVVAGKMQSSGADVRIQDKNGNDLAFWIENGTINKTLTNIWVKIGSIAANSKDTLYLFYGNNSAVSFSAGQNTFELFDDFNSIILDNNKWSKCGGGTATQNAGEITLQSIGLNSNSIITSKAAFAYPVVVESQIKAVPTSTSALGLVNSSMDGWVMAYEKTGQNAATMSMMQVRDTSSNIVCNVISSQNFNSNTEIANATQGIWGFTWTSSDSAKFKWPGGIASRVDTAKRAAFSSSKKILFGSANSLGSVKADWIRLRKFTPVEPILSLGLESQTVTSVSAQNNGPLCSGDSLKLTAPSLVGASYNWYGPDGFTSAIQNPIIPNIKVQNAGQYALVVSTPVGCANVVGYTDVVVSDSSILGTITGARSVCVDANNGVVSITGQRGQVSSWQSGGSGNGPWNQLSNTDTFLTYQNLPQTTYYRINIKNGKCPLVSSQPVKIQVDDTSRGGNLLGNAEVCRPLNNGTVQLINQFGAIANWLASSDTGKTWSNLTNTNNSYQFNNLAGDRWYSVVVKNGVCNEDTSNSVFINTFSQPTVNFVADSICLGAITSFSDSTILLEGRKVLWNWEFQAGMGSSIQNSKYKFASAGTFPVKLKVESDKGCRDSTTKNVVVWSSPIAAYTHIDVCDTMSVVFTNSSNVATGSILQNIWKFGDGDTALRKDTNHYYPAEGMYTSKLIVITENNCSDSISKTVNIWPRVNADMTLDSVCFGNTNSFVNTSITTATSVSYNWDFGDGNNSIAGAPNHIYARPDTFEVVLSTTTNRGCTDFALDTLVVYPLPFVDFSFTNSCVIDTVSFINYSTSAGGLYSSFWDFGNTLTATDSNPKIKYNKDNNYVVNLEITSAQGCKNDSSKLLEIYPQPIAVIEVNNNCFEDTTNLLSRSTGVGMLNYSWNFGDGDTSNLNGPQHVYPAHGNYRIELKVTSSKGCIDTISSTVEIYPNPFSSFQADTVCLGFESSFKNNSTISKGSIDSYTWSFDDGGIASEKDPTYLFVNPGIRSVNLRSTSNKKCVSDTTINLLVNHLPVAAFSVINVCHNTSFEPKNNTDENGEKYSYMWDYGDSNIDSNKVTIHDYEDAGFYTVKLSTRTKGGCVDTAIKYVDVYPLPTVNAGPNQIVSKGWGAELTAQADSGYYSWTPIEGLNDPNLLQPLANPTKSTAYELTVKDKNGCSSSSSTKIEVENDFKLKIYNVITPDGNGENDFWFIDNAESYPSLKVAVFNQNGREVFTSDGYDNTWSGFYGNDPLPGGTYYYMVTIEDQDLIYKGTLTILRNL